MDKLLNKIICGDSSRVLRQFPSEVIDCVVTSPPYWGLRDYGVTGQIWDGDENCRHIWNKRNFKLHSGRGDAQKSGKYSEQEPIPDKELSNHFCSKCGAWCGSLGLEPTFDLYVKHLCNIFDEVKRLLRKDGTCWVNLGDTYGGSNCGYGQRKESSGFQNVVRQTYYATSKNRPLSAKVMPKSLIMIPFRFAIEMVNRGWILRNVIVWHKPNCMPSSVGDRFTVDFEYLFFFVKNKKYWFERQLEKYNKPLDRWGGEKLEAKGNAKKDLQGMYRNRDMRPNPQGRNKRCVWTIVTKPFKGAHFAVYPEKLVETPIKAGCPKGGVVLDPFAGAGTTCLMAKVLGRNYIGIDINPSYVAMSKRRIKNYLAVRKVKKRKGFF